ncbi:binding-protein-dependent transport system inner membrane component domain-containing protein [Ditylenchus destructor]|nr:binding-protein-dependent transport system inner membrane component domain-containing protein [Ditylenchus destructor]
MAGCWARSTPRFLRAPTPRPRRRCCAAGGAIAGAAVRDLAGCADELVSYTVYRWECAIRSSVVLGFVGAGGLGQQLDNATKMFAGGEVATILLVFIALVALADRISAWLRPSRAAGQGAEPHQMPGRPPTRVGLWLLLAALLALTVASFLSLPVRWGDLLGPDALAQMGRFIAEFFPAATGAGLPGAYRRGGAGDAGDVGAGQRAGGGRRAGAGLARESAGGAGAMGLAAVAECAEVGAGAGVGGDPAGVGRTGPMPGTLALALHTTGVLGRLMAEALENAPPQTAQALRWAGASRWQVFAFATLPQAAPQLLSYTLYRWENNIRAAAVLGVVGAGGLGQMLSVHLSLFQMPETCTVLIAMLALVMLVDACSYAARRRLNA